MVGGDATHSAPPDVTEERRAKALWLAELATARQGFLQALAAKLGPIEEVLALSPEQIASAFGAWRSVRDEQGLLAAVLAAGPPTGPALLHHPVGPAPAPTGVVTIVDDEYPPRLRELSDMPPALFLHGRIGDGLRALRRQVVVAVVGTRNPSAYGREMAALLGRDLAEAGAVVVSGMALGIDAAAHRAALESRASIATVGVLGCGADGDHPPSNRDLFARVRRRGVVLSEAAWGAAPLPWRFPCRNRLIAALADAVVVVEGGVRSGAGITARLANELGRQVLAVPGEAGRKLSACPHDLLRHGAALCEGAGDVFEVLGLTPGPDRAAVLEKWSAGDGLAGKVLDLLDGGPSTPDRLALDLEAPVGAVLAALTTLELTGEVAADGDRYRRRRDASASQRRTDPRPR